MEESMTDSVIVGEHPAGSRFLGQLTLNVEKTLNSLTREMVDVITHQLETWAKDDRVVAVFIDGTGDRAFCAGGDVSEFLYPTVQSRLKKKLEK